jgi:hypothetical protein
MYRSAYSVLVGNLKERDNWKDLGAVGIYLKWYLIQDRDQ